MNKLHVNNKKKGTLNMGGVVLGDEHFLGYGTWETPTRFKCISYLDRTLFHFISFHFLFA